MTTTTTTARTMMTLTTTLTLTAMTLLLMTDDEDADGDDGDVNDDKNGNNINVAGELCRLIDNNFGLGRISARNFLSVKILFFPRQRSDIRHSRLRTTKHRDDD